MSNVDEYEEKIATGRRVFQYIVDNRMAPTPRNYELWFNYVGSYNKPLITAVNTAIRANGRLSDDDAERIYLECLSTEKREEAVDQITVEIGGELENVVSLIDGAVGVSSEYGASLDSVAEQLGSQVDGSTLTKLVESLVASTKEMTVNNRILEGSLRESKQQISDLNLHLESIRAESLTDQLTGISNRKHFDQQIQAWMEDAAESQENLCLLIGDIDHFKKFNDTFGHQTGDQVLRLVAQALKASIKGLDFAARYGGEEFAVILPSTDVQAAVTVGNNIREAVQAKELVKKSTGENLGTITMSFGVAQFRTGEPAEDLIGRADQCLYAAKSAGRNRVSSEEDIDLEFETAVA